MTSNMAVRRAALHLVPPAPDPVEAEVGSFYDRTITAVWRLATTLYAGDTRRASRAVVEAYREVWFAGDRDQASLLHALVMGARADHDPIPRLAPVAFSTRRRAGGHPAPTIREENRFMVTSHRVGTDPNADGDVRAELRYFLDAGVDGGFADHPDAAVAVVEDRR